MPFLSFSCLTDLARTSRTMLNRSGHPCLVPSLRGSFSLLSMGEGLRRDVGTQTTAVPARQTTCLFPPKAVKGSQGAPGENGAVCGRNEWKTKTDAVNCADHPLSPKHLKNKPCVCSVLSNLPSVFITLSHFSLTSTHTHSCLSDFLCTQMSFTEKLARNSPSPTHFFPLKPQAFDWYL